MLNYFRRSEPDSEELKYFTSKSQLQQYLTPAKDTYKISSLHTRRPQATTTEDSLINSTFKTERTIPRALLLINKDLLTATSPPAPSPNDVPKDIYSTPPDFIAFLDIGKGLNGFADTLHGGILATLLDEILGTTVHLRRELHATDFQELKKINCYTAQLNTRYKAPVPTPGVVIIKTWFRGVEGRKWRVFGAVFGEESGRGCGKIISLDEAEKVGGLFEGLMYPEQEAEAA